jgi:hypothetical protein
VPTKAGNFRADLDQPAEFATIVNLTQLTMDMSGSRENTAPNVTDTTNCIQKVSGLKVAGESA